MSSDEFKGTIQGSSLGDLVELYDVDLNPLGYNLIFRWVPSVNPDDSPIMWRGNAYYPTPILGSGFESTAQGQFPRPKLQVSNALRLAESAVKEYDELLGAEVTRWKVFKENLDNGSDPDQNAHFPLEVYRVDRRSDHNAVYIEFELASSLDQEGIKIPRRQVLRVCTHTYRKWNATTGTFDYTDVTCPYASAACFDKNGNPTSEGNDSCSKQFVTGCRARFGSADLPFRGFLGVQRRGG